MSRRVGIVGGGAAGIYAALGARHEGAEVVLFERNPRIGIKIKISGGGKCNITHRATPRELEDGFIRREGRFLRHAFHELTAERVLSDLADEGLETIVRENGRVFPASGRSEDVLAAFERMLQRTGVEVRCSARVDGIDIDNGAIRGISIGTAFEPFDSVVVATGGMSYRAVGTTGDGIAWGEGSGHTIVPVRPALAPIYFDHPPPPDWQGVALRNAVLRFEVDGAPLRELDGLWLSWHDDILLTHRGLSGPAALEVSRAAALAAEENPKAPLVLVIDLLPTVSSDDLLKRWNDRLASSSKSEIQSFVDEIVPRSLVPYLLESAGIESGTKLAEISRVNRTALLGTIKGWRVGRLGTVPLDRGEVTAGGIALTEVSPKTMESKRVRSLYFAGEALDIAGRVGGYNLQAAFSTGWIAGRSAGRAPGTTNPTQR